MALVVPLELRLLAAATAEEHLAALPACAWVAGGALAASAIMGGIFTVQRLMQGAGRPAEGETASLLEKDGWDTAECHQARSEAYAPGGGLLLSSLLIALPSLLGAWCWPVLLVGLFGASSSVASNENREVSHHITFGADLVFFGGAIWYTASITAASSSERAFFSKWGPVMLVAAGCLLLIWDPIRHLVLDHGYMERQMAMYSADGDGGLSLMGKVSHGMTEFGILFLTVGLLWFLKVPEKLSKLWDARALPM